VLGHPDYYPRFGFERASLQGIRSQWEGVQDKAFMILAVDEIAMQVVSGVTGIDLSLMRRYKNVRRILSILLTAIFRSPDRKIGMN